MPSFAVPSCEGVVCAIAFCWFLSNNHFLGQDIDHDDNGAN
jgi:hypothetical protein